MSRRAPGEGSISHRKDGRWQAALQLDGRRATVYGKTRGEVAEKLRGLQAEAVRLGNRLPESGKLTLAEYLDEWLAQARPRLRGKSEERYEEALRLHVKPHLGSILLGKLTGRRLAQHYALLSDDRGARTIQQV